MHLTLAAWLLSLLASPSLVEAKLRHHPAVKAATSISGTTTITTSSSSASRSTAATSISTVTSTQSKLSSTLSKSSVSAFTSAVSTSKATSAGTTSAALSSTKSSSISTFSTSTRTTTTVMSSSTSAVPSVCPHVGKRGLGYNDPVLTQPFAQCNNTGSKISWAYNWASDPYYPSAPNSSTTYNMNLNFIPMLWSGASDLTSVWARNVQAAKAQYGSDSLLGFNEPDNCDGQACMSVSDAVSAWKQYIQPFAGKFALGAPAVTNANQSGIGLDWLQQFMNQCTGCTVDFVPLHFYGDVNKPETLGQYVSAAYQQFGKPLWLTEFGAQGGDKNSVKSWAQNVMQWLDNASYVKRYAYLMDAVNSDDTWLIGSNRSKNAIGAMYDS